MQKISIFFVFNLTRAEVHHLKNWQLIIKNIYDDFPNMNIVYTGSSLLKIDPESGDLSRRQITYTLPGLDQVCEAIGEFLKKLN
ncbi:MAG: AAA family ATPase [Lachnospiraceae bacterium]|nr:AAA family ATPase [Lachnospiraceae bacterium]